MIASNIIIFFYLTIVAQLNMTDSEQRRSFTFPSDMLSTVCDTPFGTMRLTTGAELRSPWSGRDVTFHWLARHVGTFLPMWSRRASYTSRNRVRAVLFCRLTCSFGRHSWLASPRWLSPPSRLPWIGKCYFTHTTTMFIIARCTMPLIMAF